MAKKKRPETVFKPAQFSATPFSRLKGVVAVAERASEEPPKSEPVLGHPDNDDAGLFLQAMAGVRALEDGTQINHKAALPAARSSAAKPPASSPADSAASELFLEEIGRLKLEVKFAEAPADEDELKPLAGNRLKQVKRGIISVERQLDLHGLTRDEALSELPRFLRNARSKGCAAVLVITGKGLNSAGEPVLQQFVSGWLRDAGREFVVEYSPAPREMGGSGAFVVFLRPAAKP